MRIEAKDLEFGYNNNNNKNINNKNINKNNNKNKNKNIISRLSLTVDSHERTALIGPSGCGKSTLSHILAGNLKPQSGQVLIDNKPLPKHGFCPVQLICQHPEKAINPRWKLGKTLTEAWSPDAQFLEAMGIEKAWLNRYPVELSGGELQRFCIARALAPQTSFIIADEMSTMLDMITQAQIWQALLRIADERGLGLIAVTHSMELAKRVCSRVIEFESLME